MITDDIARRCKDLIELVRQQGAELKALRQHVDSLGIISLRDEIALMQTTQSGIAGLANWIEVDLAAARMTGQTSKPIKAMDLELHPANEVLIRQDLPPHQEVWTGDKILPQNELRRTLSVEQLRELERRQADERRRMEQTLHRAGDHTQDAGGEAA